jgi:hypothetical protein
MNPRIILFDSFALRLVSRINTYLDSNPHRALELENPPRIIVWGESSYDIYSPKSILL